MWHLLPPRRVLPSHGQQDDILLWISCSDTCSYEYAALASTDDSARDIPSAVRHRRVVRVSSFHNLRRADPPSLDLAQKLDALIHARADGQTTSRAQLELGAGIWAETEMSAFSRRQSDRADA